MIRKNITPGILAAIILWGIPSSCVKEMQPEEGLRSAAPYALTLSAVKMGSDTKALAVTGSSLTATWSGASNVKVYNSSSALIGELAVTPDAQDATRATLSGSLTSAPAAGDVLSLRYLSASYATQDGTLTGNATSIDQVCDYAVASVTVTSVNTTSRTVAINGPASFVNQQAIVKFTLQDTGGDALHVTSLSINDGSATYTVTPSSATDVLYVALPGISERTLSLTGTSGGDSYRYEKSGVALSAGYYYTKTVKMGFPLEYLEYSVAAGQFSVLKKVPGTFRTLTSSSTNWNGWVVARGDVTISSRITVNGTANLILCDGATLTASQGITVNEGNTLNIFAQSAGTGTLNAYGYMYEEMDPEMMFFESAYGAAIGGMNYDDCGTVNIHGGNISADSNGKWQCPGIGGKDGNCGNITIYGGTVYARGGNMAGGIGVGGYLSGGTLTIYGGDVTATSLNSAAIGGPNNGITVNIHGGRVVADASDATYGAGIGGGAACNGSNVTITGGTVIASGGAGVGSYGAATGIGAGNAYGSNVLSNGTLTLGAGMVAYGGTSPNPEGNAVYGPISDVSTRYRYMIVKLDSINLATVTSDLVVTGPKLLYGTLGSNVKISIADGAEVTLDGVDINGSNTWTDAEHAGLTCLGDVKIILSGTNKVRAFNNYYAGIDIVSDKTLTIKGTGSLEARGGDWGSAGIGASRSDCGNICIQGGTITAIASAYGAGIGGTCYANCGDITISGGTVTATGGGEGAGIGSGQARSCGTITINGGTVTASGGSSSAGIGTGNAGTCGDIIITGGTVTAEGKTRSAGLGGGANGHCGDITITSGVTRVTATKGTYAPNSIGRGGTSNSTIGTVTVGGVTGEITTSPYTYQP